MRLSVVIPCYNVQDQLPGLVHSLRPNAGKQVEFIFVEDCSTDGTPALLPNLADGLSGAEIVWHDRNRGLSAARNTGTARARGTYLVWLDSDDWIAPGYLARLVETIERFDCDFVRTDHVRVLGTERTIVRSPEWRRHTVLDPRTAIAPAFRSTSVDYPNAWAGIQHRRLAEDGLLTFAEDLRTCEDRHWIWRLHLGAKTFATVGLLGVFYRQGLAGSLSHVSNPTQLHFLEAMDRVLEQTLADPDADLLAIKAVDAYCALIAFHVAKRARLSVELQEQLIARCGARLRSMPTDLLSRALAGTAPARRRLLNRLRDDRRLRAVA